MSYFRGTSDIICVIKQFNVDNCLANMTLSNNISEITFLISFKHIASIHV